MYSALSVMMLQSNLNKQKSFIQTNASSTLGKMNLKYAHYKQLRCINIVKNEKEKQKLNCLAPDWVLCEEDPAFEGQLSSVIDT